MRSLTSEWRRETIKPLSRQHEYSRDLFRQCLKQVLKEPDDDLIRRYIATSEQLRSSEPSLSVTETRWVRLNLQHHPRWRQRHDALTAEMARRKKKSAGHGAMMIVILLLAAPSWVDSMYRMHVDSRAPLLEIRHEMNALQRDYVSAQDHVATTPIDFQRPSLASLVSLRAYTELDRPAVAELQLALTSTFITAEDSFVKAEAAFFLGRLAEAHNSLAEAVHWYDVSAAHQTLDNVSDVMMPDVTTQTERCSSDQDLLWSSNWKRKHISPTADGVTTPTSSPRVVSEIFS